MSKLEILCTTMHQRDFSKIQQMNIRADVVLANQADCQVEEQMLFDGHRARMITTPTRGSSKNRNIALENVNPDADYIMFADDDLCFYDDAEALVLKEFAEHPEAAAIKFNLNSVSRRKISMKSITHFHEVGRREIGSWGVCALAIRAQVLRKYGIRFNERFGIGTPNYCGEDTIFLQELLKKRIKLYASPVCIADIDQSESSWFEGYNDRYFLTNGMVLQECYPVLCYLLVIRSAWRFAHRPNCTLPFSQILRCYYQGIRKNQIERRPKI